MTQSAAPDNQCLAVLLTFDEPSECHIRRAGRMAAQHVGRPEAPEDGRPHITLHATRTAEAELLSHVQAIARETGSLDVAFSHWGIFSKPGVVFLGPTPTSCLVALHERICEATVPEDARVFDGLYLPGAWVPHCTLAVGVPAGQTGPWIEVLSQAIPLPFSVQGIALDVIRIEPERAVPLVSIPLRS